MRASASSSITRIRGRPSWSNVPISRSVVASALEGVAEVIVDGVSGRLAHAGDGPAFAETLARLIADRKLRCRLAVQGEAYARERFTWAASVERQIRTLAARAPRPARPAAPLDVKLSSESVI